MLTSRRLMMILGDLRAELKLQSLVVRLAGNV